jgi:hypothetical protein
MKVPPIKMNSTCRGYSSYKWLVTKNVMYITSVTNKNIAKITNKNRTIEERVIRWANKPYPRYGLAS